MVGSGGSRGCGRRGGAEMNVLTQFMKIKIHVTEFTTLKS